MRFAASDDRTVAATAAGAFQMPLGRRDLADPISAVHAPLLLIFAASDGGRRLLEVRSNIGTDARDFRSAVGTSPTAATTTTGEPLQSHAVASKTLATFLRKGSARLVDVVRST